MKYKKLLSLFLVIPVINTNAMDRLIAKRYEKKPCNQRSNKIVLVPSKKEQQAKIKISPVSHIPAEFCAILQAKILTIAFFLSPCSSVEEVGQTLCSWAATNRFLNSFINDREITLAAIKQLSQQFGKTNIDVARKLCTAEANNRLALQEAFLRMRSLQFSRIKSDLNKFKGMGLDANFTYNQVRPTILLSALLSSKIDWGNSYGYKQDGIARWIIENGGDINVVTGSKRKWRDYHVSLPSKQNVSMLILRLFHKDLIPLILQHQAFKVDYQDDNNDTPLHCVFYGLTYHNTGSSGCNIHCKVDTCRFALVCEAVEELLKKGASPLALNKQGKTPLCLAKEVGHKPFIELLEQAEISYQNNHQRNENLDGNDK